MRNGWGYWLFQVMLIVVPRLPSSLRLIFDTELALSKSYFSVRVLSQKRRKMNLRLYWTINVHLPGHPYTHWFEMQNIHTLMLSFHTLVSCLNTHSNFNPKHTYVRLTNWLISYCYAHKKQSLLCIIIQAINMRLRQGQEGC
mgnify:CR=1 FL=1